MLIQMLQTTAGSTDGFKVERYIEGQTYDTTEDISGSLAWQFIQRGQAVRLEEGSLEATVADLMAMLGRVA